jgi:hypothetical protein
MILPPLILAAACVSIEGEKILLSDLARAVPALSAAAPEETIGFAPAPGMRRLIGQAEIGKIAAQYGVELPAGLTTVCFERAAEPLAEERVSQGLRRALSGETWKLIDFSRYRVPGGDINFQVPPKLPANVPVILRGSIRYGDNRSFPCWARVKISRPPREVERGDMVAVEVSSGTALVKFVARAESGGAQGEAVLLRNPTSKICFSARITGKGKVMLDATQDAILTAARDSRRESGR